MYCTDFEYDGHMLSEFNSIICSITDSKEVGVKDIGSQLTYNTIANTATNKRKLISTQYNDTFTTTFQICKHNCADLDDKVYREIEVTQIMKWLNKKAFKRFKPMYDDIEYSNVYYMGSFNVKTIMIGFEVIGFELTLTTDAPFAYYEDEIFKGTLGENKELIIFDKSNEIGYLSPTVELKSNTDATTLYLYNSNDEYTMIINNVKQGEVFKIDGNSKTIESNYEHKNLCNDFNYRFPKIINSELSNVNVYTSNVDCDITITYTPICKAPII